MSEQSEREPPKGATERAVDAGRAARIREAFCEACERGFIPGGQLAVRARGALWIDERVGILRGFRQSEAAPREPVEHDSEFLVFSAGKPVVGVVIALLESRGLLSVDAPVAQYWPEFAANGKGAITVRDVLVHRAGVFTTELMMSPERWPDWEGVCSELASVAPKYPRGTFAYMPYEFGWILGELVRRITGRTFAQFVHDEIAAPRGWDHFTFGVSAERARSLARSYWLGEGRTIVAGGDLSASFERTSNRPEAATSIVPGAGLVTNARTLSAFYAWVLDGCPDGEGRAMIRPEILQAYTAREHFGFDKSNRVPMAVGRGFIVGTPWPSPYGLFATSGCFGHQGAFCSLGFADRDRGLSAAIVTNGNHGPLATSRFMTRLVGLVRALAP